MFILRWSESRRSGEGKERERGRESCCSCYVCLVLSNSLACICNDKIMFKIHCIFVTLHTYTCLSIHFGRIRLFLSGAIQRLHISWRDRNLATLVAPSRRLSSARSIAVLLSACMLAPCRCQTVRQQHLLDDQNYWSVFHVRDWGNRLALLKSVMEVSVSFFVKSSHNIFITIIIRFFYFYFPLTLFFFGLALNCVAFQKVLFYFLLPHFVYIYIVGDSPLFIFTCLCMNEYVCVQYYICALCSACSLLTIVSISVGYVSLYDSFMCDVLSKTWVTLL